MKVYFLIFSGLLFYSATAQAQVQSKEHKEWIDLFNSSSDSLNGLYYQKPVFITPELRAVADASAAEMYRQLRKSTGAVMSAKSAKRIAASPTIDYEIVEMEAAGGKLLKQLIIWRKTDNLLLRELEATFLAERQISPDPAIDEARNKWMELCNKHLPAELVAQVYTPDAIYYNHKPVVTGTTAISREYGYMASPQYNLKLTPLHLEMLSPDMAFELGQCSGSYGGKYVLIWVKNGEGSWQVALDSNI